MRDCIIQKQPNFKTITHIQFSRTFLLLIPTYRSTFVCLFPYFQSLLFSFSLTRYIGRILLLLLFVYFKSRTVIICKKNVLFYNFQSLLTALSGSANKEGMFYPQKKVFHFKTFHDFRQLLST